MLALVTPQTPEQALLTVADKAYWHLWTMMGGLGRLAPGKANPAPGRMFEAAVTGFLAAHASHDWSTTTELSARQAGELLALVSTVRAAALTRLLEDEAAEQACSPGVSLVVHHKPRPGHFELLNELGRAVSAPRRAALASKIEWLVPRAVFADIGCDYCFVQLDDTTVVQLQFEDLGFGAIRERLARFKGFAGVITWPSEGTTGKVMSLKSLIDFPYALLCGVTALPKLFTPLDNR